MIAGRGDEWMGQRTGRDTVQVENGDDGRGAMKKNDDEWCGDDRGQENRI